GAPRQLAVGPAGRGRVPPRTGSGNVRLHARAGVAVRGVRHVLRRFRRPHDARDLDLLAGHVPAVRGRDRGGPQRQPPGSGRLARAEVTLGGGVPDAVPDASLTAPDPGATISAVGSEPTGMPARRVPLTSTFPREEVIRMTRDCNMCPVVSRGSSEMVIAT